MQKFSIENFDEVSEYGFTKPSSCLVVSDKVDIIRSVSLHHVIVKTLGELSQFCEGLNTLGVAKAMEENGQLLRDFLLSKHLK